MHQNPADLLITGMERLQIGASFEDDIDCAEMHEMLAQFRQLLGIEGADDLAVLKSAISYIQHLSAVVNQKPLSVQRARNLLNAEKC